MAAGAAQFRRLDLERLGDAEAAGLHEQHPRLAAASREWGMEPVRPGTGEQAYRLARRTYLTSVELLAIVLHDEVFAMCETKWKRDRQRLYDATSFPGFLAHSNSFNLAQDSVMVTPADVAWVQYEPLLRLLANSFVAVLLYTALKSTFLSRQSDQQKQPQQPPRYEWSDLETLLNCPVRAKSLIRNSMELEMVDDDRSMQVAPSCALDFGVMMRGGVARSRICFSGVFTKSHKCVSPGTATPLELSATRALLLRRRISVARSSTEQAPVLLTNDTTWSPPPPDTSRNGRWSDEDRTQNVGTDEPWRKAFT
ncbi:hypothetical protein BBJ28_00018313 [Nothophytophthora sp. Chile5]|nr:hypothetical protein BBJ28_00018313 [Nothophytophthora sp. Chile5]